MSLKSKALSLFLAGSFLFNGCKAILSMRPEYMFSKVSEIPTKKKEFYTEIGLRAGGDFLVYNFDIPKKLQTNFLGFASDIEDDAYPAIRPFVGLEGSLILKSIKFKLALDGQYNFYSNSGYRSGIYDVEREPIGGESYAFSQLELDEFSFMPSISVEQTFFDKLVLGFEFGLPYAGFNFRSGRDTFGSFVTEKEDSDFLFGTRYVGRILYNFSKKTPRDLDIKSGLEVGYEKYNPRFLSERADIDAITAMLVLEFGF